MKKIIITTAVIFFSMAGIADAAPDSNSIVQDGIEYYIQTDKSVYNLGENVQMLYRVTNLSDVDVTFAFPHSPEWNFWVEKDGEYIWRAVNGWWTVMTQFTLGPGDSKQFPTFDPPFIWNMRDNENNLVNLGEYTVVGGLYAGSEYYDYTKVAVSIEIIPSTRLVPDEYLTIQAAINDCFDGDTVLVADGTYTGLGNRDIDFLGKAITLQSENGPENCIIDCEGLGRGFYFHNNENHNAVVEGFTITNGYAYSGGGIYCNRSNPTITNCTIINNSVIYYGGGIGCGFSSPTIINCIITGNSTRSFGGGIFFWKSDAKVTNCTITSNFAEWGGGIYCQDSNAEITNCTISGNSAEIGGAIFCGFSNSPTISNCTITTNSAEWGGGAILCGFSSSPTISNCTITTNSAEWDGGAIYCAHKSSPVISNCTITGNTAGHAGGAISLWDRSNSTITNCTITGNSAGHAGGGIMGSLQSNITISNGILWANEVPYGPQIYLEDNSNASVSYADVQGGYEGVGNIDADPCFVEPGYWDANDTPDDVNDDFWIEGDYYLLPDSPCIDAGDPNYIPEPDETDIDGNPRVINGRIDMGAYETNYIQAAMKFTPQTINCNSRSNWVKAHLTLPEGFLPEDVDINESAIAEPMGAESEYIDVFGNDDGPVKLEISFDREAFCDSVTETGEVEITVIGSLTTSRYFYATDTIKIKPRR